MINIHATYDSGMVSGFACISYQILGGVISICDGHNRKMDMDLSRLSSLYIDGNKVDLNEVCK